MAAQTSLLHPRPVSADKLAGFMTSSESSNFSKPPRFLTCEMAMFSRVYCGFQSWDCVTRALGRVKTK